MSSTSSAAINITNHEATDQPFKNNRIINYNEINAIPVTCKVQREVYKQSYNVVLITHLVINYLLLECCNYFLPFNRINEVTGFMALE